MASPAAPQTIEVNGETVAGKTSERDEDRYGFFVDEEEQPN